MLTGTRTTSRSGYAPDTPHTRRSRGTGTGAAGGARRGRGLKTLHNLLAAALTEFAEQGYQAVTVDGIVRRAHTSHGTFYLYFGSKGDVFRVLARDALRAIDAVADEFPVVTPNAAGKAALRRWVGSFCSTYAAYAAILRILSQADLVGQDMWQAALDTLLRLADTIVLGMAAGAGTAGAAPGPVRSARLDAVACLMMLERVNYLISTGVDLGGADLADQLATVIFTAFHGRAGRGTVRRRAAGGDDGVAPHPRRG